MNTPGNKIALLETGGSHDEIFFAQFLFLKDSGFEIHLIVGNEHLQRIGRPGEPEFILALPEEGGGIGRLKNLIRIRNYLRNHKIRYLIINTCQGAFIRDLSLFLPKKINISGIVHNPQKLGKSFNQKRIGRKVKKYLVLSENIRLNAKRLNPEMEIESFYPVFFRLKPAYSKGNKLMVCIPGAMDATRRDYGSLLEELKFTALNPGIKILFLGRCVRPEALEMRGRIQGILPGDQYEFFDEFIPEEIFLDRVAGADIILPLITPALKNFPLYRDFKIAGGINLSLGYRVPLLLHDSLEGNPDYDVAAFFHPEGKLIENLNKLESDRNLLEKKKRDIDKEPRFSFEFQKDKYTSFILKA